MDVNQSNVTVGEVSCPPDPPLGVPQYVSIAILILLTIIICAGNGFIVIVFIKNRKLRTLNNFYVINLAISDFLLGLNMPFRIVFYFVPELNRIFYACLLRFAVFSLFTQASVLGLFALTTDRYFALVAPLRYHGTVLTSSKYMMIAAAIWTPPSVVGFIIPMLVHGEYHTPDCPQCFMYQVMSDTMWRWLYLPAIIIISIVIFAMYVHIFYVAKQQLRRIQQQQPTGTGRSTFQDDWKLVKFGLIVFAAFYVCWSPFLAIQIITYYGTHTPLVNYVGQFTTFLMTLNSAIDPIIYTYHLPEFKNELKKIVGIKIDVGYT